MLRALAAMALASLAGAQGLVAELAPPGAKAGDGFGSAVAIGPDAILVGAPNKGPKYRGRAYLFSRLDGSLLRTYAPDDWAENDHFGRSVALDEHVAVIGSFSDDVAPNAGSVYVYARGSGDLLFELHPPQGAAGDGFGQAVALGSGVIAVSAPGDDRAAPDAGAVFVFDRKEGRLLAEFRAAHPRPSMRLGSTLAVDGSLVIASALWDKGHQENVGAVFVFDYLLRAQRYRLLAWDAAEGDRFGSALAARDGRLLVGAPAHDQPGSEEIGKAYLFDSASATLLLNVEAPAQAGAGARFGTAVGLGDETLLIGAPASDEVAPGAGRVYLLDSQGTLLSAIGESLEGDRLGQSLGVWGARAVLGLPQADPAGSASGSAQLYCLLRPLGTAYCGVANLNSTGLPGTLAAHGSAEIDCGSFELLAAQLPAAVPCVALIARRPDATTVGWDGGGILCLRQPIGLFRNALAVSRPDGSVTLQPALAAPLPAPLSGAIVPGETWRFQVWFRDVGPVASSNLTHALAVTFK